MLWNVYIKILNKNNNMIDSVITFMDKLEYNNISKSDDLINSINKIDKHNKNKIIIDEY